MSTVRNLVFLALGAGALLGPASAQTCPVTLFGSPTDDPLLINSSITVAPAVCTFDFQGRHVILGPNCTITVQSATFAAGRLTMQGGSTLRSSNGGTIRWNLAPWGVNDGSATIGGLIDVDDPNGGGWVDINATAYATVTGSGRINARGTSTSSDGGYIDIDADGVVFVNGAATSFDTTGGNDGMGGDVTLVSANGPVETYQRINCDGGAWDGGSVWIDAGTYASVNGRIDCSGAGGAVVGYGYGGFVDIYAATEIVVTGDIIANGPTGDVANGGGDGGWITIDAGTLVNIAATIQGEGGIDGWGGIADVIAGTTFTLGGGSISVRGKSSGSTGGSITVSAGTTALINGPFDASATGSGGTGGDITVDAALDLTSHGNMAASGDDAGSIWFDCSQGTVNNDGDIVAVGGGTGGTGGDVQLVAFADVALSACNLDARGASSTGTGGDVSIFAGHHISGDGSTSLYANGSGANAGDSGDITIQGCRVSFPAGSRLWARSGPLQAGWNGGQISIRANDILTLGGLVQAENGGITLQTRLDAPWSPVLGGATITPAPVVQHDPTLVPCLAVLTTTLTAAPVVPQGGQVNINLQSLPNLPLLIVFDLAPGYQTLGPYGYTQLAFLPGPTLFPPLADFFHIAGHAVNFPGGTGDTTDALGQWTYYFGPVIAPGVIGITIHIDAYAIDLGAENGLFHQPPRVSYTFI